MYHSLRFPAGFLTLCAAVFLLPPASPARAATPPVVINELLWMGSSLSSSDEWLELKNTTNDPVHLTGWSLTKLSSGKEVAMLTIPSGTIAPGGFFLISRNAAENSRLAVTPNLVSSSVSLVNSKLQVTLYDSNGALVDRADDGSGNPLAGEYTSGTVWKSMERNPTGGDGTVKEGWHTASSSVNFDDAAKEYGTPGAANSNQPPIIVAHVPDTAIVSEVIQFDATESADPENDTLSVLWEFGDGQSDTGQTPTHSFRAAGTYAVRVTVSDGLLSASAVYSIVVSEAVSQHADINTSPSPEPTDTAVVPEIAQPITPARTVRISRVLPNPAGSDAQGELIELENMGSDEVSLLQWQLRVGVRTWTITGQPNVPQYIAAQGFALLPRPLTNLSLPNTGSVEVCLLAPDATVADCTTYAGPAPEGQSWIRKGDVWAWSGLPQSRPSEGVQKVADQGTVRILLNEMYPAPLGGTRGEFIELISKERTTITLIGWTLRVGSRRFSLSTITLAPGEPRALFFADTRLTLSNAGQRVALADPTGMVVSDVRYPRARKGESWSSQQTGTWAWATPTPNTANAHASVQTRKTTQQGSSFTSMAIPQALAAARRTKVRVTGTVVAQPGVVSETSLYISDSAAAIAVNGASVSDLTVDVGDVVTVQGSIGEASGEKRITLADEEVIISGHNETPSPAALQTSLASGTLASTEGTVTQKLATTITLQNDQGQHKVSLRALDPEFASTLRKGDTVRVTGLLRKSTAGRRLYPRSENDIAIVGAVKGEEVAASSPPQSVAVPPTPLERAAPWLLVGVPILALAGKLLYGRWRKAVAAME